MIKVIVSTALRDLARLGAFVENYPKARRAAAVRVLEKYKPVMQRKFKARLLDNLGKISPGFANKNSTVARYLDVISGGTKERGVSGFQAVKKKKKAAVIARAWNTGAVIEPKRFKYLAEPLSNGSRVNLSAIETYGDDSQFSTWVYKESKFASSHPNIKQDVAGLMVVRSKSSFIKRKRIIKGKESEIKIGQTVAKYVLLRKQTIEPTHWADKALQEFKQKDFIPFFIERGLKEGDLKGISK